MNTLNWISRFLDQTPGDENVGGSPRQVPGKCWSRVSPTLIPSPTLRLWSTEMADELGIEIGQDEILGGNQIAKGI